MEGSSSWPGVSRRSRKTKPCAWCWLGKQGWGGTVEAGTGVSGVIGGAGAEQCCKLCPLPSVPDLGCLSPRQYPAKDCVDGAAKQGWSGHGAALEMGLVGRSTSGSAVRMQELAGAVSTCDVSSPLCTRSRESKRCLDQRLMLKIIAQGREEAAGAGSSSAAGAECRPGAHLLIAAPG